MRCIFHTKNCFKCRKRQRGRHTHSRMNSKSEMCDALSPSSTYTYPYRGPVNYPKKNQAIRKDTPNLSMCPYPSCAPWHLKFIIIFRLLHAASLSFPAYYISATLQLCHVEIFPLLIRGFLISSSMAFPPLANNATLKYFPLACLLSFLADL